MDWNDLKFVLAVSRSRSFKNAARLMKVSHTTVGRRISALEMGLGTALFERGSTGVSPTDHCLRLIRAAERMEREVLSFSQQVEPPEAAPAGNVRIHTAPWMINRILCPALPELGAAFPDIHLMLTGDVVETHEENDGIGFSLRFDIQPKRYEIELPICRVPYSVYSLKGAPDSDRWITMDYSRVALRHRTWISQNHPDAIVQFSASDADMVRSAILTGIGKGLLPDFMGKEDPQLVRETKGGPALVRTCRALVPRFMMPDPAVRAVLGWVETALRARFEAVSNQTDVYVE